MYNFIFHFFYMFIILFTIRFEFDNGTLIEQDNDLANNLWVYLIIIEIPSTDKKYITKGKALLNLLNREGESVIVRKCDEKSIKLSLILQESTFTFSFDEFFYHVDNNLDFIYQKLEKVNIEECVITLYGEISWHKGKCINQAI